MCASYEVVVFKIGVLVGSLLLQWHLQEATNHVHAPGLCS